MNKEMYVLDYHMMFANALKDMDNLITDSKELYKALSGLEYPDAPEIKNIDDFNDKQSIFVLRNDISNAEVSLTRCLNFVASTLDLTFEELVQSENPEVNFRNIIIEVTNKETMYSAEYIYENLLDCYTYWYDLLETLDRLTGIRFKNHLRDTTGKMKTHRIMELIYDLSEKPRGDRYITSFYKLIFDAVCAFSGLEKVLNFFDKLYDYDEGKAVRDIGEYKTRYLPGIKDKYLKIIRY